MDQWALVQKWRWMMDFEDAQLICCDNLEWMKSQPDNSVDLVLGSPPYEDCRTYGIGFNLKGQQWVDWMVERWIEMQRICKGVVAMVVEGKTKNFQWSATPALLMADLHRAGLKLRKPVAFHRIGIAGSGGPDWLRADWETTICTSKGKLPWSNNTAMGHPPRWAPGGVMSHRTSNGSRVNQWGHPINSGGTGGDKDNVTCSAARPSHVEVTRRTFEEKVASGAKLHTKRDADQMREQAYMPPAMANPGNCPQQTYCASEVVALLQEAGDFTHHVVGGGVMGSKLSHENEAPFPESLAEFFIRSFCPPNGIVLDPFSGSATTGAVAVKHGRRYIGLDVRDSQIELGHRRIAEAREKMAKEHVA
jgi:hypothetical protein